MRGHPKRPAQLSGSDGMRFCSGTMELQPKGWTTCPNPYVVQPLGWGRGLRGPARSADRTQTKKAADVIRHRPPVKIIRQRATLPQPSAAVPSPLRVFTSVFGMGTGVSLSLWPPEKSVRIPSGGILFGIETLLESQFHRESEKNNDQDSRRISTGQLNAFGYTHVHFQPIKVVVFNLP